MRKDTIPELGQQILLCEVSGLGGVIWTNTKVTALLCCSRRSRLVSYVSGIGDLIALSFFPITASLAY